MNIKYDEKEEKSIVIDLCGIKYKAKHQQSSSVNNKFLVYLAQIKYFIKTILINLKQICLKIWIAMIKYIQDYPFCRDLDLIFISTYIVIGGLFTFASIINEIVTFINLYSVSTTLSYLTICKTSIVIIIKYIFSYVFLLIPISILTVLIIYVLCRIFTIITLSCIFIFNTLKQAFVFMFNIFNTFYEKIPDIEPINPTHTIEMV